MHLRSVKYPGFRELPCLLHICLAPAHGCPLVTVFVEIGMRSHSAISVVSELYQMVKLPAT